MKLVKKHIVIIGANSAIARAVALRYAEAGSAFFLVGRDEARTQSTSSGLQGAGGTVKGVYLTDLRIKDDHADIVQAARQALGTVDLVLIAHGTLPDQRLLDTDIDATLDSLLTNALSPISLAHRFFDLLAEQGRGTLAVISSVAGDRGRRSNYAYGAAKAALTAYLSGLRGRGLEKGVHVLTIKPGPVRSAMTAGRKVPFMVDPAPVARDIVDAVESRRHVIYTPGIWRMIMASYRLLPEWLAMRSRF